MVVSIWVCVARHAQSTQNKLATFLKYLKENMKDEVEFLTTDKRQRFLQIVQIDNHFRCVSPSMPKLPKQVCNILRK